MLRPAKLLALLDWSDREASSGRRGLVRPSLPEVGRPDLESGITTQPSWGKTVTGLPPAGALPLQAARSVATLPRRAFPPLCCATNHKAEERRHDRLQGEPV